MNFRRLLIAFTITVLVIGTGIYYQSTYQPTGTDQTQVSEDQSASDQSKQTKPISEESATSGQTFTIEGKVTYPDDVDPQSIRVTVEYFPTRSELPRSVQGRLRSTNLASLYRTYRSSISQDEESRKTGEQFQDVLHQRRVMTDPTGEFQVEGVQTGIFRAVVSSENWGGQTNQSYFQSPGKLTTMKLTAIPGGQIRGQVIDNEGNPVSDANVKIPSLGRQSTTSQEGTFQFSNLPTDESPGNITVNKEGFRRVRRSIDRLSVGQSRDITVRIEPKGSSQLRVEVVDSNDNPVNEGGILLIPRTRLQELSTGSNDQRSLNENTLNRLRNSEWYKPLKGGSVQYNDLNPGHYQASLQFSDFVADPKTTQLDSDENQTVTLQASRGQNVSIQFLNKETGDPLRKIQPTIRAFEEDGTPLSPGFQILGLDKNGVLQGSVDPRAEYLKITANIPGDQIPEPRILNFSRDDFPSMTAEIALKEAPYGGEPFVNVRANINAINLPGNSLGSVKTTSIHFWDANSGVLHEQKKAKQNVFDDQYKIKKGTYWILGTINANSGNYTFFQKATFDTGNKVTVTVTPEKAASLSVRVNQQRRNRLIRLGVAPFTVDSDQQKHEIPGPREYPFNLIRVFDGDRVSMNYVPPNVSLRIITRSHEGTPYGNNEERNIRVKEIEPINPGGDRSVSIEVE